MRPMVKDFKHLANGAALGLFVVFSAAACSDVTKWKLRYEAVGEAPDLVLIFRQDEQGDVTEIFPNFNANDQAVNYQPQTLEPLLEACANQVEADSAQKSQCVALASHIGGVLFQGTRVVFDPSPDSEANTNVELGMNSQTINLFVLFVYEMTNPDASTDETCLKLVVLRKTASGLTIPGEGSGTSLNLSVERGDIAATPTSERDCFPLGL